MELVSCKSRSSEKQCKLSDYVSNKVAATIGETRVYHTPAGTPSNHSLMEQQNERAYAPRPSMSRLQHDLKSPSVNVRSRALKAIKSPPKVNYTQFDVQNEERSVMPRDDREIVDAVAPTLEEVMSKIIVYVEVRTGEDNRSAGVKKVIAALGARINDKLLRDTTHVVFKDGLMSTYKKAKLWNIPVVSILWIEACKNVQKICNPEDFPISNLDRYENPELYEKMKRHKCMQPDSECNRRIRAKNPQKELTPKSTPVRKGTSTPLGNKLNQPEISRFFKSLDTTMKTPNSAAIQANIVDSPATVLINRMTSNNYTPIRKCQTDIAIPENNDDTPLNSRRSSIETNIAATTDCIAQLSICQTPTLPPENDLKIVRKKITQRRRTLLPIKAAPDSNGKGHEKDKKHNSQAGGIVLMTEEIVVKDGKTANSFSVRKAVSRRTTYSYKPMEITDLNTPPNVQPNQQVTVRRRTLYTPQAMVETTNVETVATPNFAEATAAQNLEYQPITYTPTEETETTTTPTISSQEEAVAQIIKVDSSQNLNSVPITPAQQNGRRRTLFDISMDIISHQVQNINSKTRQSIVPQKTVEAKAEGDAAPPEITATNNPFIENTTGSSKTVLTAQSKTEIPPEGNNETNTTERKKRKLFQPMNSDTFTPPTVTPLKTSSQMSKKSLRDCLTTPKAATKRRRTLFTTQTPPITNVVKIIETQAATPQQDIMMRKKAAGIRSGRRSTMDFEAIEHVKALNTQLQQQGHNILKESNNMGINNNNIVVEKQIPRRRLPFLAFTNMHKEQIDVINEAVDKLGGFHVDRCVGSLTTHMVSLEARRTMNLLRGLVRGLWILDYRWVTDSLLANQWLPEEQYEMTDFSRAVEICRAERQAFGNSYKCELFADLGSFFISPRCDTVPIRDLKELIRLCGGKIVEQRALAKYILSSSTKAIDDKIYVTPLWILDSITQMQLLRIQKYSGISQLPTLQTASNTRNMPTAVEVRDGCSQRIYNALAK